MVRKPILILSLLSLLSVSAIVEARTFKIATIVPDGTTWMKKIRAGAKTIKKETNGRVKFKFYTGGIMGSSQSILKKMRIGQLHGGALTGGGLANVYPDVQIYSLPFLFNDFKEVDYVRKTMDPLIMAGLDSKGLKGLGLSEGGFAYFMSNNRISSVDDLIRLKNWLPAGDQISQTLYEAAGISPVPLALSDVYTGLQTGLIDTIASNPTATIAFQWHTKVKYVTDMPLVYLVGTFVMDKKAFGKIKPADQEIVTKVMNDVFKELDAINRKDNMKARDALKLQGIEFVQLTSAERKHWQEIADRATLKLKAKGAYSEKMYSAMTKRLQEYRNTKH